MSPVEDVAVGGGTGEEEDWLEVVEGEVELYEAEGMFGEVPI